MKKFSSRVLALALALALVFSLNTVAFAALTEEGEQTVTGEGETVYVDTTVFSVVLPTKAAFKFTMDPLGLINVTTAGATLDSLTKGQIIGAAPQPFINNSSVPVKITADVKAVATSATASGGTTIPLVFKDATAAVIADTNPNLMLCVIPGTADMSTPADTGYSAATSALVLSTTATTLDFALPAAGWKVKAKDSGTGYEMTFTPGTGHGNALKVGGYVNPKADWNLFSNQVKYTKNAEIALQVKFSFVNDVANAEDYEASDYQGGTYKMLSYAGTVVPVADFAPVSGGGGTGEGGGGDTITPGFPGKSKTLNLARNANTAQTIDFTFPAGKTANDVTIKAPNGTNLVKTTDYTVDIAGNKITLTASRIAMVSGNAGDKVFPITCGDGETYNLTIKVA